MKTAIFASITLAVIAPSMIAGQQSSKDSASSHRPRSTATQKSSKTQPSPSAGKEGGNGKVQNASSTDGAKVGGNGLKNGGGAVGNGAQDGGRETGNGVQKGGREAGNAAKSTKK